MKSLVMLGVMEGSSHDVMYQNKSINSKNLVFFLVVNEIDRDGFHDIQKLLILWVMKSPDQMT